MSEYNTQSTTYTAGYVTAYGAAKRGGYTGTYEEFCAAIAGMADVVGDLENFSVVINTLSPGSQATASYADGVLTLGVPQGAKGDKGDKGDTGEVSQADLDAAIEEVSDELAGLKNDLNQFPNGTYPNMTVGNADQLTATVGVEDKTPYLFRTSGGSVDIGDREDVKKIVGGTIVNNQLANTKNGTITPNGQNTYSYASISSKITSASHAYFICADVTYNGEKLPMRVYTQVGISNYGSPVHNITETGTKKCAWLAKVTSNAMSPTLGISNVATSDKLTSEDAWSFDNATVADLTLDLGTSIADYVYNLEHATAGAGVAWLKKHFPAQFDAGYQAYDAGSLQSVSGLTEHRMVGFNQWDEETEIGDIDANGQNKTDGTRLRSKNYIPVVPNTNYYFMNNLGSENGNYIGIFYYDANKSFVSKLSSQRTNILFTTPDNCAYARFVLLAWYGTTYSHDICINLSDPTKNGTYEPYTVHSYALDSDVVLRGIPKLDSNNQLYYDGDEYLPDGTVNRRFGVVDLGTLTWVYNDTYSAFYGAIPSCVTPALNSEKKPLCTRYVARNVGYVTLMSDKEIMYNSSQTGVLIKDSAYSDASTFKTAMNGVYLVYELATPTTETALPYQETQIVDDFGTEEFVLADGAFPVPVGHNTMYQNNLRAKLEMSPDSPDGDGLYVVQQESGENTYVPLASTATIQDILTRLTALENA